jgi:hypothetical protein
MGNPTPPDANDLRRARRRRNFRRGLTAALVLMAVALGEHFVVPATARDPKPKSPKPPKSQFASDGQLGNVHGGGKSPWRSWGGLLDDARAHGHKLPEPPTWWGYDHDKPHGGAAGSGNKPGAGGSGGPVTGGGSDGLSALAFAHDGVGGGPGGAGGSGDGPGGSGGGPGAVGAPNGLAGFPNGGSGGPGGGGPNGGGGGQGGGNGNGSGGNGNGGPGNNDKSPLLVTTSDLDNQRATVPEPGVTIVLLGALGILVTVRRQPAQRRVALSPSPRLRSGRGRGNAGGR